MGKNLKMMLDSLTNAIDLQTILKYHIVVVLYITLYSVLYNMQ